MRRARLPVCAKGDRTEATLEYTHFAYMPHGCRFKTNQNVTACLLDRIRWSRARSRILLIRGMFWAPNVVLAGSMPSKNV